MIFFSVSALAGWKINRKARAIRCNDVKVTDKLPIFLNEFVYPAFTFFTDFQPNADGRKVIVLVNVGEPFLY